MLNMAQMGMLGSVRDLDTNSEGQQAFLFIGDSTSVGVTNDNVAAVDDTVYSSDGVSITELSTAPQFGVTYNSLSTKKPVIVRMGVSSSTIYPNGNNNNWYTSGDNYAPAKTAANATLALLGVQSLKGIIVNLGINDASNSQTIADITTGANSLITRLKADFPGVPIVIMQIGQNSGTTSRIASVRKMWRTIVEADSIVSFCSNYAGFVAAGLYSADNLHLSATGNNEAGAQVARWFHYDTFSKWSRSVIASHFDDLSTVRKNLIATFIDGNLSDYLLCDSILNFKSTVKNNTFFDWGFLCGPLADGGFTFSANSHIASNGSTTAFQSGFNTSYSYYKSSQNDNFTEIYVKANSTNPATTAHARGATPSLVGVQTYTGSINQAASFAQGRSNDLSNVAVSVLDNGLNANSDYLIGRSSSSFEEFFKNSVSVGSASNASQTGINVEEFIGAISNNGVRGNQINAQFTRSVRGAYNGFNAASFFTAFDVMQAAW